MVTAEAFLTAVEDTVALEEELVRAERRAIELTWIAEETRRLLTRERTKERKIRRRLARLRVDAQLTVLGNGEGVAAPPLRSSTLDLASAQTLEKRAARLESWAMCRRRTRTMLERSRDTIADSTSLIKRVRAELKAIAPA